MRRAPFRRCTMVGSERPEIRDFFKDMVCPKCLDSNTNIDEYPIIYCNKCGFEVDRSKIQTISLKEVAEILKKEFPDLRGVE